MSNVKLYEGDDAKENFIESLFDFIVNGVQIKLSMLLSQKVSQQNKVVDENTTYLYKRADGVVTADIEEIVKFIVREYAFKPFKENKTVSLSKIAEQIDNIDVEIYFD